MPPALDGLPLGVGSHGQAVVDLRGRLTALGLGAPGDPPQTFGMPTELAVRSFQTQRGLWVDGVCGSQTWEALVEAGRQLGERLLYRRVPMVRGDDVADLQRRLGGLGFDTGRVDGIFGDHTAMALADFQRNVGITVDAILGRATLAELLRLQTRSGAGHQLVSGVRERESLRRTRRSLAELKVAVGHPGGLDAVAAALSQALVVRGATVLTLLHPNGSRLAADANTALVDLYLGLRVNPDEAGSATAFYEGFHYQSPGGRRMAELVQQIVPGLLDLADHGAKGMSVAVLRETRMPAVVIELGPSWVVVQRTPELARGVCQALAIWADTTWD